MTWAQDGGMAAEAGLVLLLGRIDERTARTEADVREIKSSLNQGDKRMDRGDRRVDRLETDVSALKKASGVPPAGKQPGRLTLALAAITGIAPLKEWMLGVLVIFLGLKGAISPADVKALIWEYLK